MTSLPVSPLRAPTPIFDVGCAGPKRRILILTAGYGEGHNAAARALAEACNESGGPDTARVVDVFSLASPRLDKAVKRSYLYAINRLPRIWSWVYAWTDRSRLLPRYFGLLRADRRVLEETIARERPGAICSTYPVYAFLLERLRRQGRLDAPAFNVVTDSISINSLWWKAGATGWFLPNQDSADVVQAAGIGAERLHVLGFPVTLFFARHAAEMSPPDLAAGARPRVLYILNSGTRSAEATARRLLAIPDWEITCAVGRDETLRRRLEGIAAGRAAATQILGWTDAIPRLLLTHHVVISKAGGATTQEAVAARCPMIVSQVVPGQEEGNYELLRRHGAGTLAETPEAVEAALRAAFADGGALCREWRRRLEAISRPSAAREIAARLLVAASAAPAEASPATR